MPDIGDELYGLPPTEFIAARTALVARLRADGEREVAAKVKQRRRPMAAAAELNRILRLDPDAVEELVASAGRLRDASQRALQGVVLNLDPLRREHRAQAELLASHADRDHAQLRTALETASLDEALHEPLRAAVFVELPTPTQGFDLLTPVDAPRDLNAPRGPRVRPPASGARGEPRRKNVIQNEAELNTRNSAKVRAKSRAANDEERAAARDRAARRHDAAELRAATARKRVTDLEARLQAAIDHLRQCEAQVEAATQARERAEGGGPTTRI